MQSRRGYHQHCGLAKALDVVGERWTLLLVRDLLLGPRRYGDLVEALPGIGTNLLAKRLRELEEADLVTKVKLPAPVSAVAYELTAEGRALEPALHALARWGGLFLPAKPKRGDRFDLGWYLLSLKRRYLPGEGVRTALAVKTAGRVFCLVLGERVLDVREGDDAPAPLTITGEMMPIAMLCNGRASLAALEREGGVKLEGARDLWSEIFRALGNGSETTTRPRPRGTRRGTS